MPHRSRTHTQYSLSISATVQRKDSTNEHDQVTHFLDSTTKRRALPQMKRTYWTVYACFVGTLPTCVEASFKGTEGREGGARVELPLISDNGYEVLGTATIHPSRLVERGKLFQSVIVGLSKRSLRYCIVEAARRRRKAGMSLLPCRRPGLEVESRTLEEALSPDWRVDETLGCQRHFVDALGTEHSVLKCT